MTGSEVSCLQRSTKCFKRPAIIIVLGESTVCNEYELTVSLTLLCTGFVIEEFINCFFAARQRVVEVRLFMSPRTDAISEAMLALNSLNSSMNSARGETVSPTGPGLQLASLCLLSTGHRHRPFYMHTMNTTTLVSG